MKHLSTLLIAAFFATMLYTSCESELLNDNEPDIKLDYKIQVVSTSPEARLYVWNYSMGADSYLWTFSEGASVDSVYGYIPDTTVYIRKKGEFIVTLAGISGDQKVSKSDTTYVDGVTPFIHDIYKVEYSASDTVLFFDIENKKIFAEDEINENNDHLIDFVFVQYGDSLTLKSASDPIFSNIISNPKQFKMMYNKDIFHRVAVSEILKCDTLRYIDIIPNEFSFRIDLLYATRYVLFQMDDSRKGIIHLIEPNFPKIERIYTLYVLYPDYYDRDGRFTE